MSTWESYDTSSVKRQEKVSRKGGKTSRFFFYQKPLVCPFKVNTPSRVKKLASKRTYSYLLPKPYLFPNSCPLVVNMLI